MEFRTMELPENKVYMGVLRELVSMIQRHTGTCYRHFIMICIWNMVKYLNRGSGTRFEVPVGMNWHTDLVTEPELLNWGEAFSKGSLSHLMLANGNQSQASSGIIDEMIGTWMALQSVKLSDTPCWYRPSENLCYLLAATKLSGVYTEDIQLPYPAFWLELPKGLLKTESVRGWHDVCCVGISTGMIPGGQRRLVVSLVQEPLRGDDDIDDVSYDASTFPLDGEEPLEVVLQQEHDRHLPSDGGNFRAQIFGSETNMEGMRNVLFNLILGFILYLRERNAQVLALPAKGKAKGKNRRGLAEMKKALTGKTWLVGTKIHLNPIIRQAVREGGGSISHHHKTVVPGHSQRYRIGPRVDWHYEVRRKDPYVRGGDGPILGHSYDSPPTT